MTPRQPGAAVAPAAAAPASPVQRALALPLALPLAVLLLVLLPAPAHATGYRYWSFWKSTGSAWTYQQQGPAVYVPPDGSVDGWRFAVSPDGGQDAARPGSTGDFAALCADTPAQSGRKRVAVVLDFGTTADAPSGETPPTPSPRTGCAVVATAASSAEVLAAVAPPLRYDSAGILCAISGYPKAGCGDTVNVGGPASSTGGGPGGGSGDSGSGDGGSGPVLGVVAGVVLIAGLGGAAVWQARRRRS
ncbi:SCO2322 family protein [Kitasatospora sp. NPDC096147]|uniref:SCO2322 family protein n=1 Tax=Kitasatospora sp. NPDC096147 TaxID=3364093 RepID=UPI00381B053C